MFVRYGYYFIVFLEVFLITKFSIIDSIKTMIEVYVTNLREKELTRVRFVSIVIKTET